MWKYIHCSVWNFDRRFRELEPWQSSEMAELTCRESKKQNELAKGKKGREGQTEKQTLNCGEHTGGHQRGGEGSGGYRRGAG